LTKDDTVTGSPTEQNGVGGIHGRGQELGLFVDVFEVVLLTTVPASVSTTTQRRSSGSDAY
jgi:hypothetical protein